MSLICPTHNVAAKLVPGGVSKNTGKAYDAFWACPVKDCRVKPVDAAAGAPAPRSTPNPTHAPQAPARAAQAASGGCSEKTLLLLGCLDFASRVYQGTGNEMDARAVAVAVFDQVRGEL